MTPEERSDRDLTVQGQIRRDDDFAAMDATPFRHRAQEVVLAWSAAIVFWATVVALIVWAVRR